MAQEEENNGNLPQEHPLLNSVVLKQVFDYLKHCGNLDTLKSVCQVCTVWRDESLDLWRETAVLNLTPEMTEDPELVTITQLLELDTKPFQKYKLKDSRIDILKCLEEGTQANRFWNTVGPHVKQLTQIGFCYGVEPLKPKEKHQHAFMQFLIDQLPNLNTLDIHRTSFSVDFMLKSESTQEKKNKLKLQHPNLLSLKVDLFVDFFAFSNFPNLQHLALGYVGTLFQMFEKVQSSEGDQAMLLKDLELLFPENTTFMDHQEAKLDLLGQIKFPALERLSVDYRHGWHDSCFRFLPVFLRNHFEKLKILEVSCFPYVHPYSDFPFDCQLDQLTELRLWGNVVKDLSFLKWTPKLKVLHMDPYGLEKKDVPGPRHPPRNMHLLSHDIVEAAVNGGGTEGIVLDDLTYLQINHDLLSLESLKILGEWMPNVKTLRMILKRGFISVICNQWPLLEHLVAMHGSILTDEDVIGSEKQGEKGLLDLGELKTFHLNAACDEGMLTEVVAHSGFLKMTKLTDLQICVSEKFTLDTEELLKGRIWKVVITRNYSENEEHKDWNCCKNTNHMQFLR